MALPPVIEELREILLAEEIAEHKRYKTYLLEADPDRSLLLTAHLVIESALASMISTQLHHPEPWLQKANFLSKVNLAKALGLIGSRELAICTVLNKARNEMVHTLQPLSAKWKVELERLAYGSSKDRSKKRSPGLGRTLLELFVYIAAASDHAAFNKKIRDLTIRHGDRWVDLMKAKMWEDIRSEKPKSSDNKSLRHYEVSLQLVRELQQQGKI